MQSAAQPGPASVAVVGLGYVGCVTAACLAHLGHDVTGVDRDGFKADAVQAGRAPFHEPELEALIQRGRTSGRLRATTSMAEALEKASIVFLCVGTPSEPDGQMSTAQLRRVAAELATLAKPGLIVAVRSTAFPGTCEEVIGAAVPGATVVAHPEFLREGCAVRDFLEPALLVVGSSDAGAARSVAALYESLPVEPCYTSLRTAEVIKYACNAFHALKIGFANEMGTLCGALGINGAEVMAALVRDTRLNASGAYLRPGFAFGGSCLPKDLRALGARARQMELKLPLLEAIEPGNAAHLDRAVRAVLERPGRVGVYGLAYKEDTDDLRESPALELFQRLIAAGRECRAYDPCVLESKLTGTNLEALRAAIPTPGAYLVETLEALLEWADEIVVTQPPSAGDLALLEASGKTVRRLDRGLER